MKLQLKNNNLFSIKNIFNNNYIINKIELNKQKNIEKIARELKTVCSLDKSILINIYNKAISIHQSNKQKNGDFLKNDIVVKELNSNKISYKQHVSINKDGVIIGFNKIKSKSCHIIDFVIGTNIRIGKYITNYKVISCKTTCRERWTQDNWTLIFEPIKYILITLSNDYPSSLRFREDYKRKIITCYPKIKDDRIYKLSFENLIDELH